MANVTKPIILDETGQAIVEKLDAIADAMTPPTAEDIATSAISGVDNVEDALDFVNDKIDEKTAGVVKSVNAIHPDAQGEVKITNVPYSDNFTSDKTQNSEGEFIIRTAGGDASISDGDAFVTRVYGNRVHTGYSPESMNMEVTMTPRVAPDPITAALNAETFEAYVSEAGIYTLTYTSSWSADPSLYGVTVTGTPLSGDSIEIDWDGESEPYMTVTAPRVAPDGISATINRDTFVGYVSESGVTTLTYTTMWSANPALYGVTVTGTPVSGDYITITYYKEQRGTIAVATPSAFKSTWWNLYNHTAGYAYLTKYSTQYGFRIGGTYTALQYSETLTGTKSSITPVDGVFTIPGDGYVWVTGGNNTNTYIINQWSDWTDGPAGDFEAYSETTINLATIMNTYFPYGLLRVGVVRDEINVNASLAISKIDRMAYNAENLASAKASGRAYEYDSNYIYIVKASYDSNSITLDGDYMASDHGNEFFVGTSVPVYLETMYGNNLKNKLERDVVTISQQTLTSAQQTQVRNNLSAASQADITTLNGSLTTLNNKVGLVAGARMTALSSIKTFLQSVINSMSENDYKFVRVPTGADDSLSPFVTWTDYVGFVHKQNPTGTYWSGFFVSRKGIYAEVACNDGVFSATSINDELAYNRGETITVGGTNAMYAARVGWAGKEIWLTIPLGKPIASDVPSCSITSMGAGTIYACTANSATQVAFSSITDKYVHILNDRCSLSIRLMFGTAPLSITDGIVNMMLNTSLQISFA